jgi:hypothetical protein
LAHCRRPADDTLLRSGLILKQSSDYCGSLRKWPIGSWTAVTDCERSIKKGAKFNSTYLFCNSVDLRYNSSAHDLPKTFHSLTCNRWLAVDCLWLVDVLLLVDLTINWFAHDLPKTFHWLAIVDLPLSMTCWRALACCQTLRYVPSLVSTPKLWRAWTPLG